MNKEKPPDYFKCIKVPLKYVVKHDTTIETINETVIKANKIVINTLQFIKLYCLKQYHKTKTLPIINEKFISTVMKTLCVEPTKGKPGKDTQELKAPLIKFYDKVFSKLLSCEKSDYLHMNTILDYLATDTLTMYENNIKQHFVEYIERYVNVVWEKKFIISKIRKLKLSKNQKNERVSTFCSELRKIKHDILNVNDKEYKSKWFYHDWINNIKKHIIPHKEIFDKNNIYYDIQCHPQDYLPCMIFMMKYIEKQDKTIFNVFPLRTDIIPKHIKIDTTSIIHMLMHDKNKCLTRDFFLTKGNLKRNEDRIWKFFFRTERKCFRKKKYTFHHMIYTDGVSCSILLVRNDMIGKRLPKKKLPQQEKYIDELDKKDYENLKDKKIVAIDPNKSDLLYCVDGTTKNRNQYRYTQDQRRKETKMKKYRNIQNELKTKQKIGNKNIIEMETELSDKNRKTLNIKKFKEYIKEKNKLNDKLFKFYENEIFRKLRLDSYINKMQNEQKMIKEFIATFGEPKDTIICIGDFEQKHQMKYKEPTKGKGLRTLLRKNGFDVYLVNEFRTSCRCFKCHGDCETFRTCKNPRPWRKDEIIICHGLTMCKTCKALWNRDENSSCNIYKIAQMAIQQKERPKYLCREKKQLSGATSAGLPFVPL
jgi:hypothetical protein